ncbi:ARM repeat-containing protein [Meredithblackwellia eburnea MCA 4105]
MTTSTGPTPVGGVEANDTSGSQKSKRRLELRQANLASWASHTTETNGRLDTSLKRHTALLTKLKSSLHSAANAPAIVKEINSLALEKYIEEAVGAVFEGLGKCKSSTEIAGAVEIISSLHCRFPNIFTPSFTSLLLQGLKPSASTATDKDIREKEDQARIVRQRGLLRVLGELEVVGVVVKKEGTKPSAIGDVSWAVLKELLTADKGSLSLVAPLAIAFSKYLGNIFLPPVAAAINGGAPPQSDSNFPTLAESNLPDSAKDEDTIVSKEVKDKFRKLLVAYLEALGRKEGKEHIELQKTDRRNHEAYIRSGEIFDDREKNYEKSVRSWERGWASVTQLSEILGLPVPPLPSLTSASSASIVTGAGTSSLTGEEIGGPGSLWPDEEDKRFYEELRELKGEVPGNVLGLSAKESDSEAAKGKDQEVGGAEDMEVGLEILGEELEIENPIEILAVDTPDASLPAGPAAQLTAVLARLPDASSKATIDSIAIDFAFLNSKAARKRLVKTLGSVNRNRQDILPYYSRLVATLNPYMPDIGKDLVALLEEEFRYLQRKKNTDLAETRSKNLRFLAELTKFGITPPHSILHILKVLLDDFSGPNIDNLCTTLEFCGRYMLRSEPTSERMKLVLDTMKRKMAAMHLDQRQVTMLENAYYQCDPPDRPIVAPKERTPMQLYIRHLFYHALTRNSVDKVRKLVRKLHWEDPSIVEKLHSAFTKVWKIKYSNVHLFAVLLHELSRHHPDFAVSVIDEVLENVRIGMEINSFKYNQQRIATIKYLGELYNYRVIDSRVVFDTLWTLVTFGHPEGRPFPDSPSPIDSPDDCFRVRLVCTLLDTCGACFERGALKKKLDNFVVFFQMYILAKKSIPMDVEFMVSDTFEQLRPKLVLFKEFADAAHAVDEMLAAVAKSGPVEEELEEEMNASEYRQQEESDEEEDGSTDDEDAGQTDVEEGASEQEEEVELGGRGRDPNAMTQEEEDDFSRELAKMMVTTSGEARKPTERKQVALDFAVPVVKRQRQRSYNDGLDDEPEEPTRGMSFTLLTKKGNKQQTLTMEIPLESAIAVHTLEKRAQDKAEQQELKKKVLDYEQREEENEKLALREMMARRGVNVKFVTPKGG